jgi:hypothetical protein
MTLKFQDFRIPGFEDFVRLEDFERFEDFEKFEDFECVLKSQTEILEFLKS